MLPAFLQDFCRFVVFLWDPKNIQMTPTNALRTKRLTLAFAYLIEKKITQIKSGKNGAKRRPTKIGISTAKHRGASARARSLPKWHIYSYR